jgi:hypothetical protein
MQKHYIDIAKRIQLAAAISPERNKSELRLSCACFLLRCRGGRGKRVPQKNIDKIDTARTNLATATACLVFQAQSMFFDLEKFFVDWKDFRGALRPGNSKLILGVGQDLFEMAGHHMSILARACGSASDL